MAVSFLAKTFIFFIVAARPALAAASVHEFSLDCEGTFAPDASAASLAKRFGAEHLTTSDVYVGEGSYEAGLVLFAGAEVKRVEILWKDPQNQRAPRIVSIRGKESHWRTIHGLTLGTDLKTLERINGVPFTLAGFGWDYSGTVTSWAGGLLGSVDGHCRTVVRLAPEHREEDPIWSNWYEQVIGDREFSSNHPAMQELNPKVYVVVLSY